jgi:hypothetical protein
VKTAIENAVRHAVDVATSRGGRLVALSIRCAADHSVVTSLARAELKRLGHTETEVHVVFGTGELRLQSVEVEPGTSRR